MVYIVCVTDLDKPPSDKDLERISNKIAYIWKRVGVKLGLEACRLHAIESDYSKSCKDACLHMLFEWRDLNNNVSRRVLDQAIKDCKNNREGIVCIYIYT